MWGVKMMLVNLQAQINVSSLYWGLEALFVQTAVIENAIITYQVILHIKCNENK